MKIPVLRLLSILMILSSLFFSVSCSNKNPKNEKLLHSNYTKIWKLTKVLLNNQEIKAPLWQTLTFNYDGTGISTSSLELDKDSLRCDYFKWELKSSLLNITEHLSHDIDSQLDGNYHYKINIINEDVLVLEKTDTNKNHIKETYIPLVKSNYNATKVNMFITNGQSKIWKSAKIKLEGKDSKMLELRKDDYWMFNSDGTGSFSHGETIEGNNKWTDLFTWKLSDDEKSLIFSDFEQNSYSVGSRNIIELNDSLFVSEGFLMENGKNTGHRTVTFVPVLPKFK